MGEAVAIEKARLGDFFGNRRGRRRNRRLSPYRVGEKWLPLRQTASGPQVHFNARLYDPELGRFLSVDPLIAHPGSTQAINPYSYVENNPLNKTDPTGESPLTMPQLGGIPGMNGRPGLGPYPCGVLGDLCGAGGHGIDIQGSQQPTQAPATGVTTQAEPAQIASHDLDDQQKDGIGGNNPSWWQQAVNNVFGKVSDAFDTVSGAAIGAYKQFTADAAYSAQWWANKQVAASNPFSSAFYGLMGGLATLGTADALPQTALTLGTAGFGGFGEGAFAVGRGGLEAIEGLGTEEGFIQIGANVTRRFGGESDLFGESWTTDPLGLQSRNSLGLETNNSAEFIAHGTLIESAVN